MGLTECWMCLVVLFVGPTLETLVSEFSSNTTVLLGNDATLLCTIQYQTEGSIVLWKKIDLGSNILTLNNKTTHKEKYEVVDQYNLIIKRVRFQDEGMYECDTGEQRLTVALQIAVPMSNMSVHWDVPVPFQRNAFVNLTCISINSRPPATLRWFRGAHEVTHASVNNDKTTRENGYGDSSSTLIGQVSSEDVPYVCIADLPDNPSVRSEFLFPPLIVSQSKENMKL
ncbi:kin of IRRE-like protein 1 [Saccostrea echinata]|uniref:kin of IRRE-like protein 1 n=1 Tax=Saccostrea echinata TaxID=191078 RepID=UPI002A81D7C2|nr:kin of IRRE-like protein 1 [Saccostrea echinata]